MQGCATQAMPTKLNNSLDSPLMLTVAMTHSSVPRKPQGCKWAWPWPPGSLSIPSPYPGPWRAHWGGARRHTVCATLSKKQHGSTFALPLLQDSRRPRGHKEGSGQMPPHLQKNSHKSRFWILWILLILLRSIVFPKRLATSLYSCVWLCKGTSWKKKLA